MTFQGFRFCDLIWSRSWSCLDIFKLNFSLKTLAQIFTICWKILREITSKNGTLLFVRHFCWPLWVILLHELTRLSASFWAHYRWTAWALIFVSWPLKVSSCGFLRKIGLWASDSSGIVEVVLAQDLNTLSLLCPDSIELSDLMYVYKNGGKIRITLVCRMLIVNIEFC